MELVNLKSAHGVGGPTTFTQEFGAAWCKMDRATFKTAFAWLLKNEFVVKTGEHERQGRHPVWLFYPGFRCNKEAVQPRTFKLKQTPRRLKYKRNVEAAPRSLRYRTAPEAALPHSN
jgi:hypothetical protein